MRRNEPATGTPTRPFRDGVKSAASRAPNRPPVLHSLAGAVLDQLADSIAVLDRHGTIVVVNEAWRRFARTNGSLSLNDESTGQNYLAVCDATAGEDGPAARAAASGIRAVIRGSLPSFTLEYPCHSPNARRWFLLRVTPLSHVHGRVVVQHIDITPRRLAEEEQARLVTVAQASQREATFEAQKLEAVFTAIRDGLVVIDEHGVIVRANSVDRATLGSDTTRTSSAESVWDRAHRMNFRTADGTPLPEDQAPGSRVLRGEVLANDAPVDILAQDADGQPIEISVTGAPMHDAHGQVIGGVLVYRDVTDRHRLERRTREMLNAMLKMAQSLTASPLTQRADDRDPGPPTTTDGVAIGLAELVRQVFGCKAVYISELDPATDQLLPCVSLSSPTAHAQQWLPEGAHLRLTGFTAPALMKRLPGGKVAVREFTERELRRLPTAGTPELLIVPLRLDERLLGVLGIDFGGWPHLFTLDERALASAVGDLAAVLLEHLHLRREAHDAQVQADAAREVTRQMDQFFATAAHDIRSPVSAVQGTVDVACRRAAKLAAAEQTRSGQEAELTARVVAALDIARESTDKLARMTVRLFDVALARTGSVEVSPWPCDLAAVVREQVEAVRAAAPRRDVRLRVPPNTVSVMADADRLGQVLTNYLTNALKYSPEAKPVVVWLRAAKGQATVSVRDAGPGLPPEEQSRVWELFHQAPSVKVQGSSGSVGSLGMGLHISKRIVESHPGGQVGLRSTVGHGSTFWFRLPLARLEDK